jgi:prepilin-type N-terminal cleavage/methylation domain-containing protein
MKIINRNGFSLSECIIVMAVMAIMAAIALPNYGNFMGQRRLDGSFRQIQTELMLLRMQAISENRNIAMAVTGANQYTIFNDQNSNGVIDSGEIIAIKTIDPAYFDVNIAAVSGYVPTFYANGTATFGRITCTGSTGTKEIQVSGAGRVKVL